MLILLRTQVERTDKTPVTACRARVGGFVPLSPPSRACTHQRTQNQTLRRRAGAVQERQEQKKDACERISAEGEAASGKAAGYGFVKG